MAGVCVLPSIGAFRDRREERAAIEERFANEAEWRAMALCGRRRAGKPWLFRAFARGRGADVVVASTRALHDRLAGFAGLPERDGERPALPGLESFFRLLCRRARDSRRLAIADGLPCLWTAERDLPSMPSKAQRPSRSWRRSAEGPDSSLTTLPSSVEDSAASVRREPSAPGGPISH